MIKNNYRHLWRSIEQQLQQQINLRHQQSPQV